MAVVKGQTVYWWIRKLGSKRSLSKAGEVLDVSEDGQFARVRDFVDDHVRVISTKRLLTKDPRGPR